MRKFDLHARCQRLDHNAAGALLVTNDLESATALWAAIMAMGYRDGAHEVRFFPESETSNLFYSIAEASFQLVPVPHDLRDLLVESIVAISGLHIQTRPKKRKSSVAASSEILVQLGGRSSRVKVTYDPSLDSIALILEVDEELARIAFLLWRDYFGPDE
jgi:hypothetical protein